MSNLLTLAERVALLRLELKAAEEVFHRAVGTSKERPAASVVSASLPGLPEVPIAERLRNLLKDSKAPMTFGDIVVVLGTAHRAAARSALKKERERGHVRFKDGRYTWAGK